MINAGNLKYKLLFKKNEDTQSESGFIQKVKRDYLNVRASKINNKNNFGVDSKELFYSSILEFKLRYNKLISNDLIVEYDNIEYRIISLDEQKFDNSLNLIIEKIND